MATWAGTAYTALVIDAFSRLIAGWRTAASHSTDLVLDALVMAVTCRARQGVKVAGLIHHSDAGSEYLSICYGAELAASGIAPSVGSVGDSYDNALAETIVGLYKTEVIVHLGLWETPAQVEAATSEWASWYNTARVMRRTGGPPAGRIRAGLAGRHARPGSRPRPGQQAPPATRRRRPWPPLITQAGSARTRRGAAPDPGPPQRCPGMSRRVRRRVGISSPVEVEGCRGTPAQVKGASGVAGDDAARHPLTSPGNPRRKARCPTRRYPAPRGDRPGGQEPATMRRAAGQRSWTDVR